MTTAYKQQTMAGCPEATTEGADRVITTRSGGAAAPEFRLARGLAGLGAIEGEWSRLLAGMPQGPHFFHQPQWFRAYVASLSERPDQVCFVTAYRDDELVAVIPLEFQALSLQSRLRPRVLGTIDHDEMQLSDFVLAPAHGQAELLAALFRWLDQSNELPWDALRLRKVPDFGHLASAASGFLPRWTQVLQHDSSAWFDTSRNFDHATRAISGTFKRNLRRLSRRAEQTASLRHESVSAAPALPAAFERFVAIEASGWKGSQGSASAIACSPTMLAFYRDLMDLFGASGQCVINLLWYGDEAVAGQFCLKSEGRLNVLKVGYSAAHASFAPGNLLLERVIRDACDDPAIDMLSLVNHPPWARNFKPNSTPVRSYVTPARSARGALLLSALLLKRAWSRWRQRSSAAQAEPAGSVDGDSD